MSPAVAQVVHALGWTLLDFVWQGVVIAAAAAVALHGLRRHTPQLRYLVACLLLAACALLPALGLYARLTDAPGAPVALLLSAGFAEKALAARGFDVFAALSARVEWLVAAWCCGALLLTLRTAVGLAWIARMRRQGVRTHAHWQTRLSAIAQLMGVRRPVALRVGVTLPSPVTAGWLKPVVIVPASLLTSMPTDLLEALLAHEVAHIRRHDYVVNLVQNAVETALFYHPAVWWLSGRVRAEREFIADDLAGAVQAPRRLAEALAALADVAPGTPLLAASGGDLLRRIRRLVQPPSARSRLGVAPSLLLAVLMGATVAAAAIMPARPPADRGASIDVRHCPAPRYPRAAQRANQQGMVVLRFTVSADGRAVGSEVDRSSGYALLDIAAKDAIGTCRFTPSIRGGKPVAGHAKVAYAWKLD